MNAERAEHAESPCEIPNLRALRSLRSLIVAFVVYGAAAVAAQTLLITGKRPARMIESIGPTVTPLPIGLLPGGHAIWGATGQDSRGHIWFGIAMADIDVPSAHLIEYDPVADKQVDRGNVVEELERAGIARKGDHQAKIHSKIVQGPDNFLYFASMDEEGEGEDGSRLPTWGGHLWRMNLDTYRWEHLLAVREALIAVAGGGRYIYSLGYFGHVLYRYDTKTGAVKNVVVGSVGGHISRNFVVDYRGHAFVPRLRGAAAPPDQRATRASIVEFDGDLREVHETPIDYDKYTDGDPTNTHGIIAVQEMSDRSWYFTTHVGFLFHVVPPPGGDGGSIDESPATVSPVSWFHPNGRTYVASLFTSDGTNTLLGLAHDNLAEGANGLYQWLTCDLAAIKCRVAPFNIAGIDASIISRSLLYGSATRDAAGRHYIVGIGRISSASDAPIVLRVEPRKR